MNTRENCSFSAQKKGIFLNQCFFSFYTKIFLVTHSLANVKSMPIVDLAMNFIVLSALKFAKKRYRIV